MYPQMNKNIEYTTLNDISNISVATDDNRRLCKDLCKAGICISCFCGLYLLVFLRVIHEELNMDIVNMTYFQKNINNNIHRMI